MKHFSPPKINRKTYAWSVRAFSTVKRLLGVNIKLHAHHNQVEKGHIFLFNHFARFETFIPQYLIYQEQKAYCRSVAAAEFFKGDERFTNYLHAVGAVPNDMPNLLSFLARDILCGKKIIIFPEGGMVKDRRSLSSSGDFSVYSPTAEERRKHHSGASRLALVLDIYKRVVIEAHKNKDEDTLKKWADELHLNDVDTLLMRCQEPTRIVPSNITFYPIRISDNFLKDSVERLTGKLSRKYQEELLIEGNIVLKDTDMDIRMGTPIESTLMWPWWDQLILKKAVDGMASLNDLFAFGSQADSFLERIAAQRLRNKTEELRDQVMQEMYGLVTINLSHIASALILKLIDEGADQVPQSTFLHILYLAARYVSHEEKVHLHRSMLYAETYRDLRDGSCEEIQQFFRSAQTAGLIKLENQSLTFQPKLKDEHDFHDIRLENPICVYANECEPITGIDNAIQRAMDNHLNIPGAQWAQYFYEDELHSFEQSKLKFSKDEFEEINKQQTATKDASPFYLSPKQDIEEKATSILLVHGFLASPAEMRGLGEDLAAQGYWVYGARLEGHGTSPCDLRDRSWAEWMRSLKMGYEVLAARSKRIIIVGFSTGGALALRFAAERPDKLAGLCAISTPLKFANPNLVFVPLIHHANRLAKWLAAQEGVLPYIINESEHPDINYKHIPVRALHELRLLVDEMEQNLHRINCPARLIQGDAEKVVKPESADLLRAQMVATTPEVVMIPSTRHGIVTEDIGGTRQHIIDFIEKQERK
ncbi:alpha/beta fold hydrolase [Terasakiella sp. SH-1]|uniref:alpha/beta fold hydrolase n=1 Tax=Terasakiella sp. SH-1 TaxID=2560057 RepID=UPI001073B3F1|nr:alpha/beta fold hydrolase [Terasakiella sp. SH-1]